MKLFLKVFFLFVLSAFKLKGAGSVKPFVSPYFCLVDKDKTPPPTCSGLTLTPENLDAYSDLYPLPKERSLETFDLTHFHPLIAQSTSATANQMFSNAALDTYKLNQIPLPLNWQSLYKITSFGGSLSEGQVLVPTRGLIKRALSLGTLFLPPDEYGGSSLADQIDWLLDPKSDVAENLVTVAKLYSFDGYFINAESSSAASRKEDFGNFILALKEAALKQNYPLHIEWYVVGGVDINHTLVSESGEIIADSAFVDHFIWEEYKEARENLNPSQKKAFPESATEYGAYGTAEIAQLEQSGFLSDNSSLSFFTFNSIAEPNKDSPSSQDENLRNFWSQYDSLFSSHAFTYTLPFVTDFNTGRGLDYYVAGESTSYGEWSSLEIQAALPKLTNLPSNVEFDYLNVWSGGSSLLVHMLSETCCFPSLVKEQREIILFDQMNLDVKGEDLEINVTFLLDQTKKFKKNTVSPELRFYDTTGFQCRISLVNKFNTQNWITLKSEIQGVGGTCELSTLQKITLAYSESNTTSSMNLGKISITKKSDLPSQKPIQYTIKPVAYGGSILKWEEEEGVRYYELYKDDKFLGASFYPSFWVLNSENVTIYPVFPKAHKLPKAS